MLPIAGHASSLSVPIPLVAPEVTDGSPALRLDGVEQKERHYFQSLHGTPLLAAVKHAGLDTPAGRFKALGRELAFVSNPERCQLRGAPLQTFLDEHRTSLERGRALVECLPRLGLSSFNTAAVAYQTLLANHAQIMPEGGGNAENQLRQAMTLLDLATLPDPR